MWLRRISKKNWRLFWADKYQLAADERLYAKITDTATGIPQLLKVCSYEVLNLAVTCYHHVHHMSDGDSCFHTLRQQYYPCPRSFVRRTLRIVTDLCNECKSAADRPPAQAAAPPRSVIRVTPAPNIRWQVRLCLCMHAFFYFRCALFLSATAKGIIHLC